jgi:ParB family transcriptional regulator, chromosome partitioning protein
MIMLSDTPAGDAAAVPVYEARTLYQVPIDLVREDPNQPRKSFDAQALEEMVASVTKHGIIQPVIFRRGLDGTAIVVAGERRVAAARQAGLTEIPGIFIDGNAAEIALVENLQRQDLTPIEEAEGLQALMNGQKYTQEQLGGIIGKAQNTLSEILSLNKLPQEIRDDCRGDRTISRSALIVIAKKKQARGMTTAYNLYKTKLQKGKATRQRKDPNEPQAVFDTMEKAIVKIRSIDTSAWTEDDKTGFQTALTSLKTEIDNYLNAALPPATKKKSKTLA